MQPTWTLALRHAMALAMFIMGLVACGAGMWVMLAREYQQAMKSITVQSNRLHARFLSEVAAGPVLDGSARLVDSVNQLIRTAMGMGAFLCLLGAGICIVAFYILTF